jgi:hypothetical protein
MVAGEAAMVCCCCGDGSGDGLALKDGGDDDNDMRQWQLWRWPGLEAWGVTTAVVVAVANVVATAVMIIAGQIGDWCGYGDDGDNMTGDQWRRGGPNQRSRTWWSSKMQSQFVRRRRAAEGRVRATRRGPAVNIPLERPDRSSRHWSRALSSDADGVNTFAKGFFPTD